MITQIPSHSISSTKAVLLKPNLGAEIYDQDQLAKKQHVMNINETLNTME